MYNLINTKSFTIILVKMNVKTEEFFYNHILGKNMIYNNVHVPTVKAKIDNMAF